MLRTHWKAGLATLLLAGSVAIALAQGDAGQISIMTPD